MDLSNHISPGWRTKVGGIWMEQTYVHAIGYVLLIFYGELEMSCNECCSSTDPISYCSSVLFYAHSFFAGREDFKAEEAS